MTEIRRRIAASFFLASVVCPLSSVLAQPPGPDRYTLNLSAEGMYLVLKGLTKLTIEEAAATLNDAQAQRQKQIDEWKPEASK